VLVALASFMRFSPTENRTRGCVSKQRGRKFGCARDDKWRVVTFIKGRQIGWTEKKQQASVGMTITVKINKVTASQDDDSVGPLATIRLTDFWTFSIQ
jgi:hypothetical protein